MFAETRRYAWFRWILWSGQASVVCMRRFWWGIVPPPACVKCGASAVVFGVDRERVRHCRVPSRGRRQGRGDSSHTQRRQLIFPFEPDHEDKRAGRPYEKSGTKRPPCPGHYVVTIRGGGSETNRSYGIREVQSGHPTDGLTRDQVPKPNARDRTHTSQAANFTPAPGQNE